MGDSITIFDIMKAVIFWSSPVLFLLGIILVLYGNYKHLEDRLGAEIGGIKKKIVPAIETNIYTFHSWLTAKKTLIGLICIIFAMAVFFTLR
ncbi:MAG: hypothetical protein ACM3IL_01835 [Deltaproteobacteria bacterium]